MPPPDTLEGAAVLAAVKVGLEAAECAARSQRRPTLTASARVGRYDPRSGRENACGAVEQKNEPQARGAIQCNPSAVSPPRSARGEK
jgi:hypothetical protein